MSDVLPVLTTRLQQTIRSKTHIKTRLRRRQFYWIYRDKICCCLLIFFLTWPCLAVTILSLNTFVDAHDILSLYRDGHWIISTVHVTRVWFSPVLFSFWKGLLWNCVGNSVWLWHWHCIVLSKAFSWKQLFEPPVKWKIRNALYSSVQPKHNSWYNYMSSEILNGSWRNKNLWLYW